MWISKHFSTDFRYFHDGLQTIEHFGTYIDDLVNKLTHIRQNQFEEKRDLEDVRNVLKTSPGFNKMVRNENQFWILARFLSPVVRWEFYVFICWEKKICKRKTKFSKSKKWQRILKEKVDFTEKTMRQRKISKQESKTRNKYRKLDLRLRIRFKSTATAITKIRIVVSWNYFNHRH